ncbi:MAG: phosphotransferase [Patescibacteria group bacterium]
MTKTTEFNNVFEILIYYELSENGPVHIMRESGDNKVYLIGEKDKKILRVSKRLPIEDVQFEYEVLKHLANNNFPVPVWVKTKEGALYASIAGVAVAVMFEFLEGYHAPVNKDILPAIEQAHSAGRALGSMAEIGKTFKSSSFRRRNIFSELERVLQNEEIFKNDFEGGDTFVEQVKQVIKFGQEAQTSIGLIHNDYRSGNVFFKNDNEISGVIDFDWSCIGPHIKDLGLAVLEWSFSDGQTEPDFTVFDAFLDGYNSISTQKYTKGKELYLWIMFAALSDASTYFCDRLNQPNLVKDISSSHMYQKYLFFSKL